MTTKPQSTKRSTDDIVVEFIQNFTRIPLDEAAHRELVRIIEAERTPAASLVDEQSIRVLAAEHVANAARMFCEELQEDAEGVPQPQLTELNKALDAWEAYPDARDSFDDGQPVLAALASLIEDDHATDHQRRVARLALTAIQTNEEELDRELRRWQDAIRDKMIAMGVPDSRIDGAGCDSGDPLDFTLAEVGQGVGYFVDQLDELPAAATAVPVEQQTFKNTKEAMLYAQRNNVPVVVPVGESSTSARAAAEEIALLEKPNHSNEFIASHDCDICNTYRQKIAAIIQRHHEGAR